MKTMESSDNLKVVADGDFLYYLSPGLALKQEMTAEDIEKVKALHVKLHNLFIEITKCSDETKYPQYVKQVEDIEYEMQDAWKFERDVNRHSWWYKIPHCVCPVLDNIDSWGLPRRVISGVCPMHGKGLVVK